MNAVVNTSYSTELVVLSYVISVIGAFVALYSAGRLRPDSRNRRAYFFSIAGAGVAFGGIGVWSMHFIAMLAMRMDVGLGYSIWETLISLIAAIAISSLAFHIVALKPDSPPRLLTAGAMLGMGAVMMHYLGMYGMRFGGHFQWDLNRVGISVAIALIAATVALWLAFHVQHLGSRIMAAFVMAIAVCAMHYTGMSAAEFICTTENRRAIPSGSDIVSVLDLPLMVITLAVGMSMALLLDLAVVSFQDQTQARNLRKELATSKAL
ncbi:MHYT domain-containing protein [Diaphorobacter ruginosibacter]|uniref:MHYT domain-containing protein n=1 Tax=Diaphorobacter ruginosibacter TaxID=1715720 RepID=UPI00333FC3F7